MPYSIGNITDFLNDKHFFNGYTELKENYDFSGEWNYTAIAFESGNYNFTKEVIGGEKTFDTYDPSNFGSYNAVNFDTANLYFSDGAPANVALDTFVYNSGYFRVFQLTADSNKLDWINNLVLTAGTFIVGFNDNYVNSSSNDSDFDDIIVAMAPAPVPEPATMLLLGSGLLGIAGVSRKRLLN